MPNELVSKIYQSIPEKVRSVWMDSAYYKLADIATALAYLLAAWDNIDNPTRDDLLSEVQNRITNVLQMVRSRDVFADDEGKNGGSG